jgi:hypothetical protein
MWQWDQSKGELTRDSVFVSLGYAGKGRGKNSPSMQAAKAIGPIPQGMWKIGDVYNSKNTGPYTIILTPMNGTQTFGRSAFRIHGDSIKAPGTASKGCVILPRVIRERIIKSGDTFLKVIE